MDEKVKNEDVIQGLGGLTYPNKDLIKGSEIENLMEDVDLATDIDEHRDLLEEIEESED